MISERKLAYYEHVASQTCSAECQKIITQLVDEVRKLEREADWLADGIECIRPGDDCAMLTEEGYDIAVCIKCWRNQAREACRDQ